MPVATTAQGASQSYGTTTSFAPGRATVAGSIYASHGLARYLTDQPAGSARVSTGSELGRRP